MPARLLQSEHTYGLDICSVDESTNEIELGRGDLSSQLAVCLVATSDKIHGRKQR